MDDDSVDGLRVVSLLGVGGHHHRGSVLWSEVSALVDESLESSSIVRIHLRCGTELIVSDDYGDLYGDWVSWLASEGV